MDGAFCMEMTSAVPTILSLLFSIFTVRGDSIPKPPSIPAPNPDGKGAENSRSIYEPNSNGFTVVIALSSVVLALSMSMNLVD